MSEKPLVYNYDGMQLVSVLSYEALEARCRELEDENKKLKSMLADSFSTISRMNDQLDDCGYIRDGEEYGQ